MVSKRSNILSSTKERNVFNVPKVLYENRYYNQEDFSIFVCVGINQIKDTLNECLLAKMTTFWM